MSRHLILVAGVLSVMALAACKPAPAADPVQTNDEVPATAAELAPPLTPAGAPVAVEAAAESDVGLQMAASVRQIEDFSEQPIHLFGVASADPGVNGLHLYVSLAPGGASWTVYPIANAEAYEVVSVQPGKIGIELSQSEPNAAGDMAQAKRRVIVSWTLDAEGTPTGVTVTPAA